MPEKKRNIIITSALTYPSGPIHLGHILEYTQTDIWARFQKLRGHTCYFLGGVDAHGTPTMIKAQQQNITPEQLVNNFKNEYEKTLKNFLVDIDFFQSTDSSENQTIVNQAYKKLVDNQALIIKNIEQAFDPKENIFLPDRFVKGTCPKCHAPDQYGDHCEKCSSIYNTDDLIDPYSVISGETPIKKSTEHVFFNLPKYQDFLQQWLGKDNSHVQTEVSKKLQEWFTAGLKPWDITRDAPYFGFKIPERENQYFYVWLDAPLGYIASLHGFCSKHNLDPAPIWNNYEIYHFIGKDITYFHALFWPALLHACEIKLPDSIFAHGFLTINGEKLSKSRGTAINADKYLELLPPEYLRYYFASKLSNGIDDINLDFEDFCQKVNSDLVGKFINIASRVSKIINNKYNSQLADNLHNPELTQEFINTNNIISSYYENRNYNLAMREIMALADKANQYIDQHKPWAVPETAQQVCTQALNLFKILIIYLKPVLPNITKQAEDFLNIPVQTWNDINNPILNHKINNYKPLIQRIELKQVNKMLEQPETKQNNYISYDDFSKVELKIGKIISAEHIPQADKLIKLMIDVGGEKPIQVFAGIKSAYSPENLVDRHTVVVTNLQPRQMKFGLSEGMVLAAGDGGKEIYLLNPDEGVKPGMRVK